MWYMCQFFFFTESAVVHEKTELKRKPLLSQNSWIDTWIWDPDLKQIISFLAHGFNLLQI